MGKRVPTTITYLEMRAPPKRKAQPPTDVAAGRIAMLKLDKPPVEFYRYLYDLVGRDYLWVDRKRMTDAQLAAEIQDERVDIYVLYSSGAPAGYAELDFRNMPEAKLAYFGLGRDYIGRGLGSFLLGAAIGNLWAKKPERVLVQTCTLDHPRALAAYQRWGFQPFAQKDAFIETMD